MSKFAVTRQGWLAYALAVAVVALDQASKAWILYGLNLPIEGGVSVMPGVFSLTMVQNDGMSFGLLHAAGGLGRWFLTVFALLVAGGLAWWARSNDRPLFAWAAGLLIGGSVGNVADRLRFGWVVDFLDFSGLHFPFVFNLADSAVSVGAALLLVEAFLPQIRSGAAHARDRMRTVLASGRDRGN
jgi:signal peptidase II